MYFNVVFIFGTDEHVVETRARDCVFVISRAVSHRACMRGNTRHVDVLIAGSVDVVVVERAARSNREAQCGFASGFAHHVYSGVETPLVR